MSFHHQPDVTAWYNNTHGNSTHDFAQEAYEDALRYFEEHLTRDQDKIDWVHAQNSMKDVLSAVQTAQKRYQQAGDSKVQRSICAFASRVQYYGGVLDVLAQHHPEYVALAWGAIKFVFTGVLNHAELVIELSKALSSVADVLPHVKLGMDLYPTAYMKEAVARVYAYIMLFLQKATKWYSMSPARRALSALAKPYAIGYKDTVDQIRACTESIHLVAAAAARAELRDQTILLGDHTMMLKEQTAILQKLDADLKETKRKTQHICSVADASQTKFDQIIQVTEGTRIIASETLGSVNEQGVRIRDIQLSGIIDLLKPLRLPDDVLFACNTVAQRRQLWRNPTRDSVRFVQTLNLWINAPASSLFVLQAGLKAEARAKDLALQATTLLKNSQKTVFWYFSERCREDIELTMSTVLKTLLFQIVTCFPDILHSQTQLLNVSAFQSQHSEQEWWDLLALLLRQIDTCFLVIEMEDLLERFRQNGHDYADILKIFNVLVDKVESSGTHVKILLVYSGLGISTMSSDSTRNGTKTEDDSSTTFSMHIRPSVMPVKRNFGKKNAAQRARALYR